MVEPAEEYLWSSAAAHCGLKEEKLLATNTVHWKQFEDISDWSAWLSETDNEKQLDIVHRNLQKNLPCGSDVFIKGLEKITGQMMQFRPVGRPKKCSVPFYQSVVCRVGMLFMPTCLHHQTN